MDSICLSPSSSLKVPCFNTTLPFLFYGILVSVYHKSITSCVCLRFQHSRVISGEGGLYHRHNSRSISPACEASGRWPMPASLSGVISSCLDCWILNWQARILKTSQVNNHCSESNSGRNKRAQHVTNQKPFCSWRQLRNIMNSCIFIQSRGAD